jgi:NAD(P)-dependent dehydrogenase (short-subunit alcohol dehydrogenase family)
MPERDSTGRRAAFVTGASTGIGAAIALGLARDGFDVAVSATRAENLAGTVAALAPTGARVVPVAFDMRSQEGLERAMAEVIGALGHLDVLINNAGITLRRPVLEVTPAEWDQLMAVNLKGAFFLSQQMGRHLIGARRAGCIINMSSTHGVVGLAQRSVYGISKGALIQMTRMLAIEWAQHGIRVNAVAPGTVETPSRAAFFSADPGTRHALLERIPLRRFATTEEVVGAVRYLVSPQAAYVTGQTLLLDGGLTAQ